LNLSSLTAMHRPAKTITFRDQPCVELHSPDGDRALISLHGAQVLSWQTSDAVERLYLSPKAIFDGQNAIRGGIPICFPQFNQRKLGETMLPKHGFARSLAWSVLDSSRLTNLDLGPEAAMGSPSSRVALSLTDAALGRETQLLWPYKFEAILQVCLEKDRLAINFSVSNTDKVEWSFALALHTYLRVPDIAQVYLRGLQGVKYWDAVKDLKAPDVRQSQSVKDLSFTSETDRVYEGPHSALQLVTSTSSLCLEQSDSLSETVVWNPGAALCAQLSDMADDGYREMVCVEAARIDQAIRLGPGANWMGSQVLSIA
jgi:glucose-6-phosphate 1-epimerase